MSLEYIAKGKAVTYVTCIVFEKKKTAIIQVTSKEIQSQTSSIEVAYLYLHSIAILLHLPAIYQRGSQTNLQAHVSG